MSWWIYTKQTDKHTGKCIGKGRSAKSYTTKGIAERYARENCFEFENENFKQEIVAISQDTDFFREYKD